jgi:hypothetical protein
MSIVRHTAQDDCHAVGVLADHCGPVATITTTDERLARIKLWPASLELIERVDLKHEGVQDLVQRLPEGLFPNSRSTENPIVLDACDYAHMFVSQCRGAPPSKSPPTFDRIALMGGPWHDAKHAFFMLERSMWMCTLATR